MSTRRRLRLLGMLFTLLIVGSLGFSVLGGDLDAVRVVVAASGPWGPVVYVALHVVLTLLPVPKNLLAVIAGALFGLGGGVALSWLAAALSAVLGFEVGRRLGYDAVSQLTGGRVERVQRTLREQGVLSVVIARLLPVVPFTVVNYGAGVSALSRRDFVAGTVVGVLPGTVAYAAVGASAGRDAWTVVQGVGAGVLLLVASMLLARRVTRPHP